MSYDYLLVKGTPGTDMLALFEAGMSQRVGALEEVKAAISRIFPSVKWEAPFSAPVGGQTNTAVFGLMGPPEFQLMVEADGQVSTITMSHAEKEEVERVTNALGLVALDEQSMEQFGG